MKIDGKRVPFLGEAKHATNAALGNKPKRFASGGRVHQYPKMKYGAGSGSGRLEKTAMQKKAR